MAFADAEWFGMVLDTIEADSRQEGARALTNADRGTLVFNALHAGWTDAEIRDFLRGLRPEAPPIAALVSLDAPIRANFCGSRTPWGEVCFDIFLADWTADQRRQVYAQKHAEGLNAIVIAAEGGYRNQHVFDWTARPDLVRGLVAEVMANGFRVVFAASSGDGPGHDSRLSESLEGASALHR